MRVHGGGRGDGGSGGGGETEGDEEIFEKRKVIPLSPQHHGDGERRRQGILRNRRR